MKASMRKISLLVFYREKQQILDRLQDLGVLHLETQDVVNPKIEELTEGKNKYLKAINIIKNKLGDEECQKERISDDTGDTLDKRDQVLDLQDKIDTAHSHIEHYKKEKIQLLPWGDFDWEDIHRLRKHGLNIKFYSAPKKEYYKFDFGETYQFFINESKSLVYFVVIEKDEEADIPFDLVHMPDRSIHELDQLIEKYQKETETLVKQIADLCNYIPAFENKIVRIDDQLNYEIANVSFASFAEGKILHIQGWFPVKIESKLRKFLDENNLSYIIEKPSKGDNIPVILKNRKYSERFEPITKMFQLPDYYEFDLTPVIAVFYPIFFAYCLGDSGYGIILLIMGIIARYTFLKGSRIIADLIIILGIFAAVLGIVKGGTFIGLNIAEHQDIAIFSFLSQYILVPDDQDIVFNTFNVALIIGLFQILVGVIIAAVRKIKYQSFIYSVATFGKFFLIIGAVTLFLGGMQEIALFVPYVTLGWILLIGGILLVLLFHDPDVSIGKRLGGGILPVYFIFTGLLGDTLSYIRLFALGVASTILGLVVNQIGNQIMEGAGPVMIGVGVLFLIFGHTLNLALASLGSFVHPLRLTFVEFYNNAEFKGGGVEYKPFKKQYNSN